MATITLKPQVGWAVGETISAYALDARRVRAGAAVTTGTVAANSTTTLTGLAENARYEATDGTSIVQFSTQLGPEVDRRQIPDLVGPPGFSFALLGAAVNAGTQTPRGVRVRVPRSGTLRDIIAHIVTQNGNYSVAVYDTGDALAGSRTKLWDSGSLACPAVNVWRVLGDPALAVTAGQQLDILLAFDGATATVAKYANPSAIAAATELPAGFGAASGGGLAKLFVQYPVLTALAWPATVTEANVLNAANTYGLLARVG